jgi:phage FluMu protein gp41
MVPTESGTLPLGVQHEGERCRGFSLRPLQARDSMAVRHSPAGERILLVEATNPGLADELMGLALLGQRLAIAGIPRESMTLELMEQLWDDDLAEVMAAERRLQDSLARFRGEGASAAGAGAAEDGDTLAGGAEDAAAGSVAVGGGLGGAQEPEGGEGDVPGSPSP